MTEPLTTVDRHAAALYVRRHPDQIRRHCTPTGTDPAGRALYDLEHVVDTFRHLPRRARLTPTTSLVHPERQ